MGYMAEKKSGLNVYVSPEIAERVRRLGLAYRQKTGDRPEATAIVEVALEWLLAFSDDQILELTARYRAAGIRGEARPVAEWAREMAAQPGSPARQAVLRARRAARAGRRSKTEGEAS